MMHDDGRNESSPETNGVTRRAFLSLVGLGGAAAFLSGCETPPAGGKAATEAVGTPTNVSIYTVPGTVRPAHPEIYDPEVAPPAPVHPLPPPVTTVEPKNTYGILPRTMWARGGPDLGRIEPLNGAKLITFHHSGDPVPFWANDFGETAQHLESVRAYHRSKNFNDIGYHFAIDRVGRVWQLRSLEYQGQHVRYNNEHNIGVVVLGNFQMQAMTQQQKDKVRIFGALLRKKYNLPIAKVFTHQEIVSTECPGRNMQPYMIAVRRQRLI